MTAEEINIEKKRIRKQIEFLTAYLNNTSPNRIGWNEKYIERNELRDELAKLVLEQHAA